MKINLFGSVITTVFSLSEVKFGFNKNNSYGSQVDILTT